MNTYYSMLGRLLDGKTPIHKKGYYILCEDNIVRFSPNRPQNVETVHAQQFVDALVNGCKEIIRSFSNSPDNKEVYAFSLYVNEYKSIFVYINTLQSFEKTLQENYAHYQDNESKRELKYNLGNFDFQYWGQHMGNYGRLIDYLGQFADHPSYERNEELLSPDNRPIIAFEAGIIDSGYYVLILEAVLKLNAENKFCSLNTTENFVAFASTGNDYIDYSIVMRKTIHLETLYEIFPDLQDKDIQFHKWLDQNLHLSASDALDYSYDVFQNSYNLGHPFSFDRSEYAVFQQFKHLGDSLAEECLKRLQNLAEIEQLESEHFVLIHCYIEALHFSGTLTREQKHTCSLLSSIILEKSEDLMDAARELNDLAVEID